MKDQTVNIPLFETDVLKTIESLPRTPTEAGIIPINLKRKLSYKQNHKTQYVSVEKILKALGTLKDLHNQYYQFVPDLQQFKQKCQETDVEGFNFLFETVDEENDIPELTDDEAEEEEDGKKVDDDKVNDDNVEDFEEQEYKEKDSVKKWQFDYNRSTCFSNNYPEINYKEDTSEELSVAPGEGKIPSNILDEKDWDLKSFPCLHPDGKNSLQSERQVTLNDQDYFVQRVMNKDTRFAENPAYVFAAIAYIEKKTNRKKQRYFFY